MDNKDFKDGDNGGFSNMGQTILILVIAATVTFFIYTLAQRFTGGGMNQELSYTSFLSMVDRNLVVGRRADCSISEVDGEGTERGKRLFRYPCQCGCGKARRKIVSAQCGSDSKEA